MGDGRAQAFRHRDFNLFQGARVLSVLGIQMQSVAIGWQIYSITGRPMDLAWVGLAQFVPAICLSLVTGQVADRFERRRILMACYAATGGLSVLLWAVATASTPHVGLIYVILVGIGVARAFGGPASQSIVPTLVPIEHFPNAVAWGSSLWQASTVLGPMLGGIVYATSRGAAAVYALAACCSAAAVALVVSMRRASRAPLRAPPSMRSLFEGIRYVWHNEVVLGSISLDLFAVLLGGATALMPAYAQDVLHSGPWALGALRSAPALGASSMAIALALWPIERRAGEKMFASVALFGVSTIALGLSHNFATSVLSLAVAGAADMISIFVRSTVVQLAAPDEMRGRVSAVNLVFIGASNELGEFESGLTAQWFGVVPAIVMGGVGTLIVVALWAWRFPALRNVDRLTPESIVT
jgi:MFS family permease